LPPLSVLVAAICAGAPLAFNVEIMKSSLGVAILFLVVAFHLSSFIAGYFLSGFVFRDFLDAKALQRTISYETGTKFLNFQTSNACNSMFTSIASSI